MRKKVLFLLAVILSLNISVVKANAEAAIQINVTFSENVTTAPASNEDISLIRKPLADTGGTFESALNTGKRLPTTGDQCNQSLTFLGYLSLFIFFLCLILGRKKEEYQHETI